MTAESHNVPSPRLSRWIASVSSAHASLVHAGAFAQVSLRARGNGSARLASALGIPGLPPANRVSVTAHGECLWLRPDEWLLVAPADQRTQLVDDLAAAIGQDHGAVVDVSASRWVFMLAGGAARDVLASCCALDLHHRVFGPGQCAQTLVAKAPVLLQQVDVAPVYRIFVRPSLAEYVVSWLMDGMEGVRAEQGAVQAG